MNGVRVFIATTEGPSEIQRILPEDPEVRSVICLNGTSSALPISGAYDAFVRKPTGVVARHFGHPVYRIDVSQAISNGTSWQLGVFLAHALLAEGRLGARGAREAFLATGTVSHGLDVGTVSHVAEKLEQARDLLQRLKDEGARTTVVLPAANAREEGVAALVKELEKGGLCRCVPAERIDDLCRQLQLRPPVAGRKSSALVARPEPEAKPRRVRGLIVAAVLGLLVAGAAYGATSVWNAGLEEWLVLAKDGRYRDLADRLAAAEAGGCASCLAARHAFQFYARSQRPKAGDFVLSAAEVRAPEGASCTTIDFGLVKPMTEVRQAAAASMLPASPVAGLCTVEYRLENASKEAVYAWLAVARTPAGGGDPEGVVIQKGELAPGAALSATARIPRWPRGAINHHVILIVGHAASADIDSWLPQLLDANERRAVRVVTRLEQIGLAAASRRHTLTP